MVEEAREGEGRSWMVGSLIRGLLLGRLADL